MKKAFCLLIALLICFSFTLSTMACEYSPENMVAVEPTTSDDGIQPWATLVISFNLAPGGYKTSSDVYNISNEDGVICVTTCAWEPQAEQIGIGWYNVESNIIYYATGSNGDASNIRIGSAGLPDGDYRIAIINLGDRAVTGTIRYYVEQI